MRAHLVISAIIGLDLGTSTGWGALDLEGVRIGSGVWDCAVGRDDGRGMRPLKLRRHVAALYGRMTESRSPDEILVGYEVPPPAAHRSGAAARTFGELRGAVVSELEMLGHTAYKGFTVADIKRAATGHGGGRGTDKDALVKAARRKWDIEPATDDEADALWCAEAARRWLLDLASV